MKIDNKSNVRFQLRLHIVLLIGIILLLAGLAIFFTGIFHTAGFIGLAVVAYSIVKILRFHYVEYENSGEVLSLRSYHVFSNKHDGRQVELPVDKVLKLYIEKSFWINYLIINIKKDGRKTVKIHFPINDMGSKDLERIEKHFIK
jgi:hypothetical protein